MFLTLILCAALAQTPAVDTVLVPTTDISVSADIGPNIDSALRDLAEQVGVTMDRLYPMYLQQADVQAQTYRTGFWVTIAACVLGIALIILGCAIDAEVLRMVGAAVAIIAALILMFGLMASLGDYYMASRNPDLWATRHLVYDAARLFR